MALAALRRRSTILSVTGERAEEEDDDDVDRVETVPDAVTDRGVELECEERERVLLLLVAAPSGEIGLLFVDNDSDLLLRGDNGSDFFVGDRLL